MTRLAEKQNGPSPRRLELSVEVERLTHYLFRYPAKFHPPVVRALLQRYSFPGDLILDPFCGSGTLMVEAAVAGRNSIGVDVDPVAVLVAQVKAHRYQIPQLRKSAAILSTQLEAQRRPTEEYARRMSSDLTERDYATEVSSVSDWVPLIPNVFHWFRRYVIIDLARIRMAIEGLAVSASHKALFRVVLASIIRGSSNADPVPVSGLEVTSYMKRREEKGRIIDPFALYARHLRRALDACESFAKRSTPGIEAEARVGDATSIGRHIRKPVDAVLCSPPYHGAVDYYRRHQLEMFWLGMTQTQADRLALLQRYVGRPKVAQRHRFVANETLDTALAADWERRIRRVSAERADAFRHYLVAMTKFFAGLQGSLRPGSPALLVVGHSTWNNTQIPTSALFREIAGLAFSLESVWWYPVKNRYMSYARRNGASIDREYVLELRRVTG